MKHVLVVAYNYHITELVASNRTRGILHYLPEYGWDVTLITINKNHKDYFPEFGNSCVAELIREYPANEDRKMSTRPTSERKEGRHGRNINIGYNLLHSLSNLKSIYKALYWIINRILSPVFSTNRWKYSALSLAKKELKENSYDAIMSTYNPKTAHQICSILSTRYHIPWVADYRDLWSQNHYHTFPSKSVKESTTLKELKTIQAAKYLTTVSQPLADKLYQLHGKEAAVIPNGFDPEKVNTNTQLRQKFTITYTGTIYNGRGSPELLLKCMHELSIDKMINPDDIAIDFYGSHGEVLSELVQKYNCENMVFDHGSISKSESILSQQSSQILLLLTWDNPSEVGVYTGKVFEYLAAKRPILSIGYRGRCVISDLLEETHAGFHPLTYDELKQQIYSWYCEWLENGIVAYQGIDEKIDQYSYRGMAKKFAVVLDTVVNEKKYLHLKL